MNLIAATGALKGLHLSLRARERAYFIKELQTFSVNSYSWRVNKAGEQLWNSFTAEQELNGVLPKFHQTFCDLLRCYRNPRSFRMCCPHHQSQLKMLCTTLKSRGSSWIQTFLDVLAGISLNDDLNALLPGLKIPPASTARLSRFMLLEQFIRFHTFCRGASAKAKAVEMTRKLAVHVPASERYERLLIHKIFGGLCGSIGSYANTVGAMPREEECSALKPFGTFSDRISKEYPDKSNIETVLTNLGIPFDNNQYWIELVYPAREACIRYERKKTNALACPTVIDARGNWAFRPDRNSQKTHGIARNLQDDSHGLPEIIHKPVPIGLLDDAIVWPKTKRGWGTHSPHAL